MTHESEAPVRATQSDATYGDHPKAKQRVGIGKVRYTVILMCCAATFICYLDRVSISVAIIPMAEQYNWDLQTQGTVLSSFYVGYLLMQVMGGFLADRFGGKIVLGMGVLLWSFFTIVTPWAALSWNARIARRSCLHGTG